MTQGGGKTKQKKRVGGPRTSEGKEKKARNRLGKCGRHEWEAKNPKSPGKKREWVRTHWGRKRRRSWNEQRRQTIVGPSSRRKIVFPRQLKKRQGIKAKQGGGEKNADSDKKKR